jgi:hypothetical protein
MDYRNYLDWTELSGIYLRQYSHGDRYRTFRKQVSPEGLNTLIVAEFLHDNPDEILNVPNWRTYSVYEAGGDKRERIELTAAALEAIGAPRAAAAVRNARSHSPVDALMNLDANDPDAVMDAIKDVNPLEMLGHIRETAARMMPELAEQLGAGPASGPAAPSEDAESWQEIEQLLQKYVALHQEQLQADLTKHGDPRTLPGFTRQARIKELEQERVRLIQRETQLEEIPKIRNLMKDLAKRVAGGGEVTERMRKSLKSPRRKFLDKLKESRKLAAEAPLPEMLALLEEAEEFMRANPAIFDEQPMGDSKLERRLAALGEYDRRDSYGDTWLHWEKPRGFDVGWNHFELLLTFPEGGGAKVVQALLDVAERAQRRIQALSEDWKRQLIEHFREREGWLDEWELQEAELDDEGHVTEAGILKMAGTGRIHLQAYDKEGEEIRPGLDFSIDWDQEHGLQLEWEDEPEPPPDESATAGPSFSPGKTTLLEPGPAISEADLDRLEQQFEVNLPAEYRSFLLQYNGGIPEPNHLALRSQGELFPYDVEFFLSLATDGDDAAVPAERSLTAVLERFRQRSLPNILLPIAQLKP